MCLDSSYPALSKLAGQNKLRLSDIAKTAQNHNNYITLADCCNLASIPEFGQYLSTLDRLLEVLEQRQCHEAVQQSFWKKIYRQKDSSFLDTVAEAVWVIHYHEIDESFDVEARFDPSNKDSKDADIKLNLTNLWLDVINVELLPLKKTTYGVVCFDAAEEQKSLLSVLCKRAIKKYNEKFKPATMENGALHDARVGVLIGMVKSARALRSFVSLKADDEVMARVKQSLFSQDQPNLSLVRVFSFAPKAQHNYLEPIVIFEWENPIS